MMSRLNLRAKQLLAREWNVEPEAIPDDAALNRHERWDSLGHMTIMLALSAEFDFELEADTVQALQSLPKIVAFLAQREGIPCKGRTDERLNVASL